MDDLHYILNNIKDHLKDYLEEKDRIVGRRVRCVFEENHKNGDSNPSASIVPANKQLLHCFQCDMSYDIFTVAHKLEGLPISGSEFWTVTVPTLAKKYGIKYDPDELDVDKRFNYQMRRFYKDVTYYITKFTPSSINEYTKSRKWDISIASKLGIGGIDSRRDFLNWLIEKGWNNEDLRKFGMYQSDLFNADNLIFTIYDRNNYPVGYAGRYIKWVKGKSTRSKYINSPTSAIYTKSKILYGLGLAKKYSDKPLYVVEGYGDWLTMYSNGIENVVALGGVALTNSHLQQIESLGFKHIIFMFDADDGGRQAFMHAAKIMQNFKNLKASVLILPEGEDPDSYLNSHSVEDLFNIPTDDLYLYYIGEIIKDNESDETLRYICEYISGYSSPIARSRMISITCERFNLNEDEILAEVQEFVEQEKAKTKEELEDIRTSLLRSLRNPKADVISILQEYTLKAHQLEIHKTLSSQSPKDETKSYINWIENRFNSNDPNNIRPLTNIPALNKYLDGGIPNEAFWMTIGGASYAGKSILTRQIALSLLDNGIPTVYMSIDEGPRATMRGLISIKSGVPYKFIKSQQFIDNIKIEEHSKFTLDEIKDNMRERIHRTIEQLKSYSESDKFFLIGEQAGSIPKMYSILENIMRKTEDIVVIIDSFQQIGGVNSNLGMTEGAMNNALMLKGMAINLNIPVICTSELNKPASNRRPKVGDLSDTRKLEFLSDIIVLVYNDIKATNSDLMSTEIKVIDDEYLNVINGLERKAPIIEYIVAKNRWTGRSGSFFMKLLPWSLYMVPESQPPRMQSRPSTTLEI